MKSYAMILQNRVIDILQNQETEPHYPPIPSGDEITAIPCDDTVKLGMIYDSETGEFSEYMPPEPEPQPEPAPTQLDRIEAAVTAKNEEIAQNAIDNYTLELMEGGIL